MNERLGFTDRLILFVQAHEGQWIDAIRFEPFGRCAWRTRISEARKRLEASGQGTIENLVLQQGRVKRSRYRFVSWRPQLSLLEQMEQPSA